MGKKLTGNKRKRSSSKTSSSGMKSGDAKRKKLESFFIDSESESSDFEDSNNNNESNKNKDGGLFFSPNDADEEEDENGTETMEEKQLRLAKDYLAKVKTTAEFTGEFEGGDDDDEDDEEEQQDPIAQRLRKEALQREGKLVPEVGDQYENQEYTATDVRLTRGHRASVTSAAMTGDDRTVYTGGKDGCVISWDVETGQKHSVWKGMLPHHYRRHCRQHQHQHHRSDSDSEFDGHTAPILATAVSMDGRHVATAGEDRVIKIWDPRAGTVVCDLEGHTAAVQSLAFRMGTHDLFSAGNDLTVRVWNTADLAFVETLFGHQNGVLGVDAMFDNAAVSCGGDGTVRYWKIAEETQLIHNTVGRGSPAHEDGNRGIGSVGRSAVDCVSHMKPNLFVAGSQNGSLSVIARGKRKPVSSVMNAHDGKWITSVGGLKFTDTFASGSHDGYVKLWRSDGKDKTVSLMNKIPMNGFVNSINFSSDGRFMVCGIGQEHRLGRWFREKKARNGLAVVKLI